MTSRDLEVVRSTAWPISRCGRRCRAPCRTTGPAVGSTGRRGGGWARSPARTGARSSPSSRWRPCRRCSASPRPCSPARPSTRSSQGRDVARRHRHRRPARRSWRSSARASGCWSGWSRRGSASGLILDLRRRVFEHVQSMPIAFFTRTHTGALVSRLNNDVIGAQRRVHVGAVGRRHQRHHPRAHARRDAQPVVADHAAGARAAAGVRDPGPADRGPGRRARAGGRRAQRGDDVADDRALLGARARRWSSCSGGRTSRPTSSAAGPSG